MMKIGLAILVTVFTFVPPAAHAEKFSKNIPVLQNVGVVPVQWEARPPRDATAEQVSKAFYAAVHKSHRFRILEDELVAGMWEKPSQRAELASQYQLHAFVALSFSKRGDVYTIATRLMSPQLETFLYESDSWSKSALANSTDEQIGEKVDTLVYRLFNRLPIDVSITSVQGAYITLSGGQQQGIQEGDQVEIVRPTVAERHPVNNSWMSFQKKKLGTAKVIEAKTYSSVAKVETTTFDGAIEVGDGAKIPSIAGRSKFARAEQRQEFVEQVKSGPVIVEPLYENDGRKSSINKDAPFIAKTKDKAPVKPKQDQVSASAKPETKPELAKGAGDQLPETAQDDARPAEAAGSDSDDPIFGPNGYWPNPTQYSLFAGISLWSGGGTSASFPIFPIPFVNRIGANSRRAFMDHYTQDLSLALDYGKTGGGSFLGLDGSWTVLTETKLGKPMQGINAWHAGGKVLFGTTRVFAESYGGADLVELAGVAGVTGTMELSGGLMDWRTDVDLIPFHFGRAGIAGSTSSVDFFGAGWLLDADLIEHRNASDTGFQFGGGLQYGMDPLKSGADLRTFNLLFLAQKPF